MVLVDEDHFLSPQLYDRALAGSPSLIVFFGLKGVNTFGLGQKSFSFDAMDSIEGP